MNDLCRSIQVNYFSYSHITFATIVKRGDRVGMMSGGGFLSCPDFSQDTFPCVCRHYVQQRLYHEVK